MKRPKSGKSWYFVDESGDPVFYDNSGNFIVGKGSTPILTLGFIETRHPRELRRVVNNFKDRIIKDSRFRDLSSISKTRKALHAKDDYDEIRKLFFQEIAELDFKAQFVVARKIGRVFKGGFRSRRQDFYDYLVSCLFEDVLHRYEQNIIYFSKRGSRDRQEPLLNAVRAGISRFEAKTKGAVNTHHEIYVQQPSREPCLSITDYMNWAVHRAYTTRDMSYFETVRDKVSYLVDIYDEEKRPNHRYDRVKNPFDIEKTTPLQLG